MVLYRWLVYMIIDTESIQVSKAENFHESDDVPYPYGIYGET